MSHQLPALAPTLHDSAKTEMRTLSIFLVLVSLLAVGCTNDEMLRASIEKDLRVSLAIGDSRATIEQVLRTKKLDFSFDDFNRRFQIRIDPKEKRSDQRIIMVYVYLDDAMRFKDVEVRNSYTVL